MKKYLFFVRQSQRFFQLQARNDDRVAAAGIIIADFVSDVPVQGGDVAALRQSAAVGGIHHQQHAGWIGGGRVEMEKVGLVDLRERGKTSAFEVMLRRGRGFGLDVLTEDLMRARGSSLPHFFF